MRRRRRERIVTGGLLSDYLWTDAVDEVIEGLEQQMRGVGEGRSIYDIWSSPLDPRTPWRYRHAGYEGSAMRDAVEQSLHDELLNRLSVMGPMTPNVPPHPSWEQLYFSIRCQECGIDVQIPAYPRSVGSALNVHCPGCGLDPRAGLA